MTTEVRQPTEAEIQQAMADLEQRLRRRHRLIGEHGAADDARDDLRNVADNWHISAHLPVTWSVPVVGRAIALGKRAMRVGLRWYINPIVDQQNDFNAAVARAFVRVAARQDALAATVESIERRVAAIEARAEGAPARVDDATDRTGA